MSTEEFGSIVLVLFVLIASAHVLGELFSRMKQPRVIGEILAGLLLGPTFLGHFLPRIFENIFVGSTTQESIIGFLYNLGLMLLMFVSGAEIKALFTRDDRREVTWLTLTGTLLPFGAVMAVAGLLPLQRFAGEHTNTTSILLVVGIAVAVTSIPVISRILHDLKLLHTRFARLVLGVAVIEDIVLWAVLAIATAWAKSGVLPKQQIAMHIVWTLLYFGAGLTIVPTLLRRVSNARWNVLRTASPIAFLTLVLLGFAAVATLMGVSLVFAAFLAGYAIANERERLAEAIDTVRRFSFAVFIPVYFAVVGFKLDLRHDFSAMMLGMFLLAACVVKLLSVGLGARLAGFGWLGSTNLAVAMNARGGPGIVLASVAYDAGIINASFYTTLVLVAVLTSQAAGAWLDFVLRKGWPLLEPKSGAVAVTADEKVAA
jgi:Kef-type K+ transport system membrane component KefB